MKGPYIWDETDNLWRRQQQESIDYSNVDVPNAKWHEAHTFTCFAYPTFTAEDCEQIGDALRKVIIAKCK